MKHIEVFFIVFLLFIQVRHNEFITGQDAQTYHLPVAKYLAEHGKLPKTVQYQGMYTPMEKPPLLYVVTMPLFVMFGATNEVAEIIPFVFLFAFLVLMFYWGKRENVYPEILFLILIISYPLLNVMTWFYQGCLVIFFSALFFYFWYYYEKDGEFNVKYLAFMMLFGILAALSKITGLFVLFIFSVVFVRDIIRVRHTEKLFLLVRMFILFLVLLSPVAIWYMGHSHTIEHTIIYHANMAFLRNFNIFSLTIALFLPTILLFPIFKSYEKRMFYIFFPFFIILLLSSFDIRYSFVSYPFLIFFLSNKITQMLSKTSFYRSKFSRIVIVIVAFLLLFNVVSSNLLIDRSDNPSILTKDAAYFLRNYSGKGNYNIFVDSDFGFAWFGNFTQYDMQKYWKHFGYNVTNLAFRQMNISFVVDSWWDFCNDTRNAFCEKTMIERINDTYGLHLIYNDSRNLIYEVIK